MKSDHDDKALQRLLNNRQLALKLIANVTYGYTSASFSGRMPCSEIADSIVQTGRETLEKAIALIHSVRRWDAEVVYGDTDSIFVYLKGRSKEQAFKIGNEIAEKVTNMNPRPIKLKFEKVYHPSVLLAKKRYVGFKYDKLSQLKPDFDAKGIETVRRDGTPAQQKIEEKALKILFKTADLSRVKAFFQAQCEKVMTGSVSIQDFCFAKEVKLGTYSDKGPPPPGALISTKRMLEDHRAEPQYGQRVPYVVITGAPGARLIDRCVAPEELLESEHSELDAEYYISKNLIPPLSRIFDLMGANVRSWYDDMPKVQRVRRVDVDPTLLAEMDGHISKATLESFMKSSSCLVCKEKMDEEGAICENCSLERPQSIVALRGRLTSMEKKVKAVDSICQTCSGISPTDEVKCDSKDCPVFYTRVREKVKLSVERKTASPLMQVLMHTEAISDITDW
jgi:DNA polymerase zeta